MDISLENHIMKQKGKKEMGKYPIEDDLRAVKTELAETKERFDKSLLASEKIITDLIESKRELEVQIEELIGNVKELMAENIGFAKENQEENYRKLNGEFESLEKLVKIKDKAFIDACDQNRALTIKNERLKDSNQVLVKELHIAETERDTVYRLIKIIKATVNGITLDGEDMVPQMKAQGING